MDVMTMKLGAVLADAYEKLDDDSKAKMEAEPGVSVHHEGRFVVATCAGIEFAWIEHEWLVDDSQLLGASMTVDGTVPDSVPEEWQQ